MAHLKEVGKGDRWRAWRLIRITECQADHDTEPSPTTRGFALNLWGAARVDGLSRGAIDHLTIDQESPQR